MITETFDNRSPAIINPQIDSNNPQYEACIVTFSNLIEQYVLSHYEYTQISSFKFVTGITPIYEITYKGKKFAFF